MLHFRHILVVSLAIAAFVKSSQGEKGIGQVDSSHFEPNLEILEGKVEKLATVIDRLAEYNLNITLVAWQDIFDEKGKLKEIRTLEFTLPAKEEAEEDDSEVEFDSTYDGLVSKIYDAKEMFDTAYVSELDTTITSELYDDESNEYYQVQYKENQVYGSIGGVASVFNKTFEDSTQEQIDQFVTYLKTRETKKFTRGPVILSYDEDSKFVSDKSEIDLGALAVTGVVVKDIQENPPIDVVRTVIAAVADVGVNYPIGDITTEIYDKLVKVSPEYQWGVIENPDDYYVTRDFGISILYNPLELDYRGEYYIYGVKK